MAREYAMVKLSIWADDDFRALSPDAKLLYFTLLTSRSLSHCGIADWRPARLAKRTGLGTDEVEHAGAEMVDSLHLVIDEESEEVLVRSFIRNDGLMKQPKMASAMASAYEDAESPTLRGVVIHELRRLKEDYPDLNGWGSLKASELLRNGVVDPSTYPLGKGSGKGFGKGNSTPSGKGCPTPAPTPAPTSSSHTSLPSADAEAEFEAWYAAYPRKVGRGQAVKAYKAALKKADAETIRAGLDAQLPAMSKSERKFIPLPATWLNGERWADEAPDVADDDPYRNLRRFN